MKKYINIALTLIVAAAMGSCAKENPFDNVPEATTGRFLKSSLKVSVETDGPRSLQNRKVRMGAPAAADFTVDFIKNGETEPEASYLYSEMPEIVTLPIGTYTAVAHYGDNPDAAWETPYYKGQSGAFLINTDDITVVEDPIVCSLANVRVTVQFDPALLAVMGADCKVNVVVGKKGSLDYTKDDVNRSGYFAYVEDSQTLAAVFTGEVEGAYANETKAYENVKPGNHYFITFKLHDAGEEDPGDITGKGEDGVIHVDATVETTDENRELDPGEETIPDTMRPQESEPEQPGQPGGPGTDQPGQEEPTGSLPSVTVKAPLNIDADNELTMGAKVEFVIDSHADSGFEGFLVYIDSNVLDADELAQVGIPVNIDLINADASLQGSLKGLGFPVGDEVKGAKHLEFDINDFVDTLLLLASNSDKPEKYFNFKLTVTDTNGTTEKTLRLFTK